ncbi:MAG TPA: cytidylate kinase-like family protein [Gemmatimonadales bacterium]|nr:cytidylate kinase-like family protein [Gemmatimonadales bacterium]
MIDPLTMVTEPSPQPIQLITISREYGAGGSELGVLLGKRLGWPVVDHELVRQLAARLSCEEGEVVAMDEHAPSFLERLAAMAVVTAPESRVHSAPWATDPDCVAAAAREVLLEAAQNPPLIVVGHGGNCLFRDRPDVLRICVAAPFDVRVKRVAQRTGVSSQRAAAEVRRKDGDRQQYLQRYYQSNVNDACEYDLQINTGTVSLQAAAHLVLSLLRTEPAPH